MSKLITKIAIVGTLLSPLVFALPALAFADTVGPINFESYTLGTINLQDGWSSTGAAGGGCAEYDHAVDVALGVLGFDSQSLRISNAVTSGCFGDMTFAKPLNNAVGEADSTNDSFSPGTLQRHFEMQFDIASAVPEEEQSGLFVSVSPDRGDGSRMSYVGFSDTPTGLNVIFYDVQGTDSPANFVLTDLGTYDRSVPHHIKLTMDMFDGPSNDIVKVWIDGEHKVTGTSWENYYRYDSEASAEQSPRIVKSVIFRTGGSAVFANEGNGFLFDNLSLTSSRPLSPGKKVGPAPKATGNIYMASPSQQITFSAFDSVNSGNPAKGTVEYWNYEYPGPLHYTTNVLCANVNQTTSDATFMFQIPAGWPGLSGLYVVAQVHDGGTPGTSGDTYGHAATADLATATSWCQDGTSVSNYAITDGNLVVH